MRQRQKKFPKQRHKIRKGKQRKKRKKRKGTTRTRSNGRTNNGGTWSTRRRNRSWSVDRSFRLEFDPPPINWKSERHARRRHGDTEQKNGWKKANANFSSDAQKKEKMIAYVIFHYTRKPVTFYRLLLIVSFFWSTLCKGGWCVCGLRDKSWLWKYFFWKKKRKKKTNSDRADAKCVVCCGRKCPRLVVADWPAGGRGVFSHVDFPHRLLLLLLLF